MWVIIDVKLHAPTLSSGQAFLLVAIGYAPSALSAETVVQVVLDLLGVSGE